MSAYDQYPAEKPPRPYDETTGQHYGVWHNGQWMASKEQLLAIQARREMIQAAPQQAPSPTTPPTTQNNVAPRGSQVIKRVKTDEIVVPEGSPLLSTIATISVSTGEEGLLRLIQGLVNNDGEPVDYYAQDYAGAGADAYAPHEQRQLGQPQQEVVQGSLADTLFEPTSTTPQAPTAAQPTVNAEVRPSKMKRRLVRPIATLVLAGVVAQGAFALTVDKLDTDNSDSALLTSLEPSHLKSVFSNPLLWPIENTKGSK